MIKKSKQNWTAGATVKVGFLTLTVVAAVATPGDFKPDVYVLSSKTALYSFVPHNGLSKVTADEARALIADGNRVAAEQAAAVIAQASAEAAHSALVDSLLAAA